MLIKTVFKFIIWFNVPEYEDWIIATNTSQDNTDEVLDDIRSDIDPAAAAAASGS